jgi:hypothetical protein
MEGVHSAALVLRIWIEDATPDGLRARLMATGDATGPGTTRVVVGSAEEVGAMVRDWVEEIATRAAAERTDGGDDPETRR